MIVDQEIKRQILNQFEKGNTDFLIHFFRSNPEMKLYKYRYGTEWDLINLKNDHLWMARADMQDDRYDSAYIETDEISYQDMYRRMCEKEPKFKEKKYADVMKKGGKFLQEQVYICCFGEVHNNADLWERYANHCEGFCIEYSVKELLDKTLLILPVKYENKRRKITDFFRKEKL